MPNKTQRKKIQGLIPLTVLAAMIAMTAHADVYTITLTNGTSFETRYEPVPAEWDENVIMISTDRGNWIGLLSEEVADVTSKAEATGFGYQVNSTTLFMGWSPNDTDEEGEEGEGLNLEEMFPEEAPAFSVQQFVNVPTTGAGVGGQPITDSEN